MFLSTLSEVDLANQTFDFITLNMPAGAKLNELIITGK